MKKPPSRDIFKSEQVVAFMTGHPSLMARYPTTSKTLLERLRTGDDVPWREFFDRYSPLIRAAGSASGLSDVATALPAFVAFCCSLMIAAPSRLRPVK